MSRSRGIVAGVIAAILLVAGSGSTTITFTDYGIDDPSGGPASVGEDGELEVLLVFRR